MRSEEASALYPGSFLLFLGAPSPEVKGEPTDDYFNYVLPPRPAQDADIAAGGHTPQQAVAPLDADAAPASMAGHLMQLGHQPAHRAASPPRSVPVSSNQTMAARSSRQRMLNINKTLGLSLSIPSASELGLPGPCRDEPQDFTSMLKRAEAELGRIGMYDRHGPDMRERLAAIAAGQIGRLLKKLGDKMLSHGSFPNRVHILTVMQSIIKATMETPATAPAGVEALKQLAYYQSQFLTAVTTLTRDQRKRLRVLEGGVWVREMQDTVELAQTLGVSADLEQALIHVDCQD
ncbi:uncharacterized protein PG998_001359 [Apiospora kogelbergensis]|uniref:uncharacterized protein n=1 Tax=Apiospora kogelbergensis TaxID=1337665 RepID=UPI00312E5EFE